jgi:hypothetical protein
MKSQIKIIALVFFGCCCYNTLFAKSLTTYEMEITQNSISNYYVKIDITLQKNYCKVDTILIALDGLYFDEDGETFDAVENLQIKSKNKIPFIFDRENSTIKICKKNITKNKISLEYGYNFIMAISYDTSATLFYNGIEKPIPVIKSIDSVYISAKIKTLEKFICVSNITNNGKYININNVAFCFVDTTRFTQKHFETEYCNVNIFTNDSTFTDSVFSRFSRKMKDCFNYFSKNISPYSLKEFNIVTADWFGSTYLGGIAFVHKTHFRNYTIVHEIAHEWLGGQIKIKKESKGEYLVGESLNEFVTSQFLKYEEGDSLYKVQIQNYIDDYNKYLEDNEDKSIWDITKYVHSTHAIIMYKEVILLDKLAQKVGYDNLNSVIFDFLKQSIGKKIEATQFLDLLKEKFGKPAIDYCKEI